MSYEEEMFDKHKGQIIRVLKRANKTKYYSALFERCGLIIDDSMKLSDFKKIPTTDKNCYNQNRYDMIAMDLVGFDKDELEKLQLGNERRPYLDRFGLLQKLTSGSTGQPLLVLRSKNENRRDYVNLNLYRKKYTKYDFSGKFVWIWPISQKHKRLNDFDKNKMYSEVNSRGYKFYLCEHTDENFRSLYDFIVDKQIEWITIPPSAAAMLAQFMKENSLQYHGMQYVECQSEKLYKWQEELIREVFGCDVLGIYSSNEIQFMGMCCSNGNIHIMDNSVFIECIENELGQSEIYVTSLTYFDIPIIRYRLGDCGHWVSSCECEMYRMPSIQLEGFRSNDMIMLENKKLVVPFIVSDAVFFMCREFGQDVKEHKIKQVSTNCFYFYFESHIITESGGRFEKFLEDYLSDCLGCFIEVNIGDLKECKDNNYYGGKFKYFERLF